MISAWEWGWGGEGVSSKTEETLGLVSEGRGIRQTGVKIPETVTWNYFARW